MLRGQKMYASYGAGACIISSISWSKLQVSLTGSYDLPFERWP